MEKKITTKFGTAKINSNGYYEITSRVEGNNGKELHRLIYEDFYNIKIPKGFIIHHKDNNRLNNCVLNLQMLSRSEHNRIHGFADKNLCKSFFGEDNGMYGKTHSLAARKKMSLKYNTSGYYRVFKHKCPNCKQGFRWIYSWYEGGKRKEISSVDLNKLKEKVLSRGLEWIEFREGECIDN